MNGWPIKAHRPRMAARPLGRLAIGLLSATLAAASPPAWAAASAEQVLSPLLAPSADPFPEVPRPARVQVEELQPVDPNSTGVLDEAHGGFGVDMWAGTSLAVAQKLLPMLPAATTSRPMRGLMARLLLTTAAAPQGKSAGEPLLKLRAERLMAMGDLDDLDALLRVAPANVVTPDLLRLRMDSALLTREPAEACAELGNLPKGGADVYFAKVRIFCNVVGNRHAEASVGLDLLREQGQSDPAFQAPMDSMQGAANVKVASLAKATPLNVAAMKAARLTIPPDAVQNASPAVLKAIADSRNVADETRLAAAEKAEAAGALDTEAVRRLYAATVFTDKELQGPLSQAGTEKGWRSRALLYRAASAQTLPTAQAEIIGRALQLARDRGNFFAVARLYQPLLLQLKPAPDLAAFAPQAARALLASGQPQAAGVWFQLVRQHAALGAADAVTATNALWPLFRLTAGDESAVLPAAALANWRKARADLPADQLDKRTAMLYSLFDALGEPVGNDDWAAMIEAPLLQAATVPRPALWHALRIATDDLRLAETVMLALVTLSEGGPGAADPTTVYRVVASLRLLGLDAEARALAIEAALANGI